MIATDMVLGVLLLFQIGFGALGNSFLLSLYAMTFFMGLRMRHIDSLFCHLTFVNNLVLLSKGIPQTVVTLGLNNFLDDVGCKLVLYLHRVSRNLSLYATCFISAFQTITICPKSSRWAELKVRFPKYIIPFHFFLWIFHLLTNCFLILTVKGPIGSKNITEVTDLIYCFVPNNITMIFILYTFIFSLSDVLCVGIMVRTSGYMVLLLHRHHKRVQYIHGTNVTPNCSPQTRATQTILLLVSMFVSFYSFNSILALYILPEKPGSWFVHFSVFLAACFPACSPFILIFNDSYIPKYSLAVWNRVQLLFQKNPEVIH